MTKAPPQPWHLLFVVGTRPEIIKMSPVIRAAEAHDDVTFTICHTNQHYDEEMSAVFFETLGLSNPAENLGVGSGGHAQQTADALTEIDSLLDIYEPDVVVAQGDTNAVLSAALATSKAPALFAHVEAGLRSGDQAMPEEVNRALADDVADLLFAPTETARENLQNEGIEDGVFVTGNTIVDACEENLAIAKRKSTIHDALSLEEPYAVATIHRPRNTDSTARLHAILSALASLPFPVVLPAHPRVAAKIDTWSEGDPTALTVTEPLDYVDFLSLLADARVVVTDSGGVQEEASILEVPCLTVRPNTERPETVAHGVNELVTPDALGDRLRTLFEDAEARAAMRGAPTLYGDGTAGTQIIDRICTALEPPGQRATATAE
ncbi:MULTISPECIES: non-hydrolyzing UDP-N-acetylglucosamine 2-epimerase [unclassified Haladaptatus]|uniref:non-hydrolyzing UDP-N-acetylglucosamine 2-epimerase n=1 Tax=unclassified Haladaptatus TaxID=2622732 RepID=UPI002FCDFCB1